MDLISQLLTVFTVFGLLGLALFWMRRTGMARFNFGSIKPANTRDREMQVLERVPVTPQHSLLLVRVNESKMLICFSPAGASVTMLDAKQ
jgi:flagellar biogenesis protein FliO